MIIEMINMSLWKNKPKEWTPKQIHDRQEFREYLNGVYASLLSIQYDRREDFSLDEIREFTSICERIKQFGDKL